MVLAELSNYRFPGNVRELENVLERAITLCENDTITAEDIQTKENSDRDPADNPADLGDKLQDLERDTIVRTLEETRYNKTAAAKKLGLSLRALRYRIQKLGID